MRAAIAPLRQAAENARTALAILVGRPRRSSISPRATCAGCGCRSVSAGLPTSLLFRRPDICSAEEQLLAADANVDVARKAFLPTITLTGQAGFQSALLSTLLRPDPSSTRWRRASPSRSSTAAGSGASWPCPRPSARSCSRSTAKAIVSALTDVENALIAVRETQPRESAQRLAVRAARRAFNLSEERLR